MLWLGLLSGLLLLGVGAIAIAINTQKIDPLVLLECTTKVRRWCYKIFRIPDPLDIELQETTAPADYEIVACRCYHWPRDMGTLIDSSCIYFHNPDFPKPCSRDNAFACVITYQVRGRDTYSNNYKLILPADSNVNEEPRITTPQQHFTMPAPLLIVQARFGNNPNEWFLVTDFFRALGGPDHSFRLNANVKLRHIMYLFAAMKGFNYHRLQTTAQALSVFVAGIATGARPAHILLNDADIERMRVRDLLQKVALLTE